MHQQHCMYWFTNTEPICKYIHNPKWHMAIWMSHSIWMSQLVVFQSALLFRPVPRVVTQVHTDLGALTASKTIFPPRGLAASAPGQFRCAVAAAWEQAAGTGVCGTSWEKSLWQLTPSLQSCSPAPTPGPWPSDTAASSQPGLIPH